MKTLHDAITDAWKAHAASLPEGVHPADVPPHLQSHENEGRRLDAILQERITPKVTMWSEGLISSVELLDHLVHEGMRTDY